MTPRSLRIYALLLIPCGAAFLGSLTVAAQNGAEECLLCHTDAIERTFPAGPSRTLQVPPGGAAQSVHAALACADCHPNATGLPHQLEVPNARQLTIALSEQCRQCHFTEHQETLESVHARAVARGDANAPVCVDCHGSHDIQKAAEPRTRVADMCGSCHDGAATTFARSVHGQDVARSIADVPTCTDCHGAHRIAGPGMTGWRSSTPEICGNCHSDEQRMRKYGLSTSVLTTYLADFHGKTASLRAATGERGQTVVAVCSDCHGTHGVVRVDSPGSPVLKANVANTCRTCHTQAAVDFPQAWLSHYEPSWGRTPAVMAVKTFYAVLIPFMIGGVLLQILMHIWRMAVNR